ncbi:MAG: CRTAC1 family protein [Acidimicrobiales bacterium]
MAQSKRLQVIAGVGALALLAGAWLLTVRGGDDGPSEQAAATGAATTRTSRPPRTTTTTEPPTTSTTAAKPANTRWGALNMTDVTEPAGLDAPQAKEAPFGADGQSGGAAVADYDGDGDQDVYLTRVGLPNRLMRNDGKGHFSDVAKAAGAQGTDPANGYAAAVWADVEGDGDLDLFLTGAGRGAALLLVNDGKGHFTDGTKAAGLDGIAGTGLAGTASFGAALDDWDHDGDLDLVALQWYKAPFEQQLAGIDPSKMDPSRLEPCVLAKERAGAPQPAGLPGSLSRLYRNDGNGRFTDATAASGVDVDRIVGFQPVFADVDGDGWEDLLVTGDYCTSRLYRNAQGGRFTDATASAGVGTDQNGMGSAVADLTGDGNLDWFVSAIAATPECQAPDPCSRAGNRLYAGDGRGGFTDVTDQYGVRSGSWGWGAAAADLNLDGRLDLVLANGARYRTEGDSADPTLQAGDDSADDPTRVWVNTGDGPWPEVADAIGVRDRANGKAAVAFDADGDGDLDVLIANTLVAPVLYRNDTPHRSGSHWLGVRLRAPGTANPYAVGATVRLADGQQRTVRAGGSFESGDPTDLHFGLGPATSTTVEVTWPDGHTTRAPAQADRMVELQPEP